MQLSASLNGSTRSASVKVAPPAVAVSAIEPARFGLQVGATASATMQLNAAQAEDTAVPLSVAPPDVLQVPLNGFSKIGGAPAHQSPIRMKSAHLAALGRWLRWQLRKTLAVFFAIVLRAAAIFSIEECI